MGKSVFLLPSPNAAFNRAQIRRLREFIGNGLLIDGPFSEKQKAVAQLVEHVRSKINKGGHRIFDTLATLSQGNILSFMPNPSDLEIPFFLQNELREFGFNANAGEIASSHPIFAEGSLVRKVSIDEIVVLAVSVLRMLGVESYFGELKLENTGKRPAVLIPSQDSLNIGLLTPAHFQNVLQSPILYIEALDNEATGSLLRIRNAYCTSELIMRRISHGRASRRSFESQAAFTGHQLYEGKRMWTLEDSDYAIANAKMMFGRNATKGMHSTRVDLQEQFVDIIENVNLHMSVAIPIIAPHLACPESCDEPESSPDPFQILSDDSRAAVVEFYHLASLMNSHIHSVDVCDIGSGGN